MTTFGAQSPTSTTLVAPLAASDAALIALIASGVCCKFSSRNRAVTTISSRPVVCADAVAPHKAVAEMDRARANADWRKRAPSQAMAGDDAFMGSPLNLFAKCSQRGGTESRSLRACQAATSTPQGPQNCSAGTTCRSMRRRVDRASKTTVRGDTLRKLTLRQRHGSRASQCAGRKHGMPAFLAPSVIAWLERERS